MLGIDAAHLVEIVRNMTKEEAEELTDTWSHYECNRCKQMEKELTQLRQQQKQYNKHFNEVNNGRM